MAAEIFRAYDVRGKTGSQLSRKVLGEIGLALAAKAMAAGASVLAVGRDGRETSAEYAAALIGGINRAGLDALDLGLTPTPAAYWAALELADGNCAVVTGSHNPRDYNGVKMMVGGATLAGDEIQELRHLIEQDRCGDSASPGTRSSVPIMGRYLDDLLSGRDIARPVKVVVDCGNGATGPYAPQALRRLGCEVLALYDQVDGTFPGHHPDPTVPENMRDAAALMRETGAELALAFDGDGDRLGLMLPEAGFVYPDRILMALARAHLLTDAGGTVVYDVKCSRMVAPFVSAHGGKPLMCRTGHSFVKQMMAATGARFAGEMSGHFFFREGRWRFDDALLAAAKLLALVAAAGSAEELFATLPDSHATPEIRVLVPDEKSPHDLVERLGREASLPGDPKLVTIDGLRAEWAYGFGLVRASNTTPCLILRFEGDSQDTLSGIKESFRKILDDLDEELELNF